MSALSEAMGNARSQNRGRSRTNRTPVVFPTTDDGWCAWYKALDLAFATPAASPLHHSKTCPVHR